MSSPTTASVVGNVDPEGQSTALRAAYALASEPWCTSHGAEGNPTETPALDLGSGSAMLSEVIVELEGLTAASDYCAELIAHNESGTTQGGQTQFTTPAPTGHPPVVATDGVSVSSPTTASVVGNVDPEGQSTALRAAYALASEPWCTSHGAEGNPTETPALDLGSGNAMLSEVIVELEGLTAASDYCAELIAHNESGTTHGGQTQFTTPEALLSAQTSGPTAIFNSPSALTPPFSPPSLSVLLEGLRVAGNSVMLTVLCRSATESGCNVLEKATSTAYLHGNRVAVASPSAQNSKLVTVAQEHFLIAKGQTKTLALSLNSIGRRLLAHSHIVPARLSAALTDTAPPQVFASKTIRFTRTVSKRKR